MFWMVTCNVFSIDVYSVICLTLDFSIHDRHDFFTMLRTLASTQPSTHSIFTRFINLRMTHIHTHAGRKCTWSIILVYGCCITFECRINIHTQQCSKWSVICHHHHPGSKAFDCVDCPTNHYMMLCSIAGNTQGSEFSFIWGKMGIKWLHQMVGTPTVLLA